MKLQLIIRLNKVVNNAEITRNNRYQTSIIWFISQNVTDKELIRWSVMKKENNIVTLMTNKSLPTLCMNATIANIRMVG